MEIFNGKVTGPFKAVIIPRLPFNLLLKVLQASYCCLALSCYVFVVSCVVSSASKTFILDDRLAIAASSWWSIVGENHHTLLGFPAKPLQLPALQHYFSLYRPKLLPCTHSLKQKAERSNKGCKPPCKRIDLAQICRSRHQNYFMRLPYTIAPFVKSCFCFSQIRKDWLLNSRRYHHKFVPSKTSTIEITNFDAPALHQQQRLFLKLSDRRDPQVPWESFSRVVEAKKYEVENLLREYSEPYNPLQTRMLYLQHTLNTKLSEKLRPSKDPNARRIISLIGDMKRKSPTNPDPRFKRVLDYSSAGEVALTMAATGFDVVFVNTDKEHWGGTINDLEEVCMDLRQLGRDSRPAVIMKDIILHPMQIALALERKADGVVLNSLMLGQDLEELLNSCMTMGTEAIVEVHTVAEAHYALSVGATILLINQWDRTEGRLKPNQAIRVRQTLPPEIIAIATGGIKNVQQIKELALAGFDAVCFGRKLMDDDVPDLVKAAKSIYLPSHRLIDFSNLPRQIDDTLKNYYKNFWNGNDEDSYSNRDISLAPTVPDNYLPTDPSPIGVGLLKTADGELLEMPKIEPQKPPVGLGKYNISTYADTLSTYRNLTLAESSLKTFGNHLASQNTPPPTNFTLYPIASDENTEEEKLLEEIADSLIRRSGIVDYEGLSNSSSWNNTFLTNLLNSVIDSLSISDDQSESTEGALNKNDIASF